MKIKTHIISLKSKHPFRIAHGVRYETDTFIVEIELNGITGYGEATPVPYYGVTPDLMNNIIDENLDFIKSIKWDHPAEFHAALSLKITNTFVLCALDMAAYDLWAKSLKLPLYKGLNLELNTSIISNYTIGIDEPEIMVEKMKEVDFPLYKIKLGTENDLEIIKELRKHTNATFRVDANCGWTVSQAQFLAKEFKYYNVEFIEQPLKTDNLLDMDELNISENLPFFADESCITESDVQKCAPFFKGVNIKLAKCGGITPALRMIKTARDLNLKVMMGCMTESSIGISAIGHLTPLLDYVDMDGAMLIANDPATGVFLNKGQIVFNDLNGHGGVLK